MVSPAGALHADVIRINDRVIATYNKIALETAIHNQGTIGAELLAESSALRDAFQGYGALSVDRARHLDEVGGELVRAAIATKSGDSMEVYAALMRAHGRINSAIVDFMDKSA
ncbi:MAG TPA: hypothetical protein VJR91_00700 [Burkholderia sp.]|nr:hypothetical protein [Burkholderia sp.]